MKKTVFFSILTILLLGLAYIFWFDFKNQFVLIGWDTMFPLNPTANLKYLTTWVDNNNGTVVLSSLHFIVLFYLFLSKISHSLTVMQFLHVYIIHVVGALGTYYLAYVLLAKHPKKIMISLLAGIMYLFTPAFLNMYFAYPPIGFVPLALALFADGMRRKNKYLFALAIGFVTSLGNLPDPHPRSLILILTPIFLYASVEIIITIKIRRVFSYFALVLIYIFLCNAWFFLGFISNMLQDSSLLSSAKEIPIIFDNKFRDEGVATIDKMFRLFHNGLVAPADKSLFYLSHPFIILTNYLLPMLAFSSVLFCKKKSRELSQNILFLLILALVFLFFAKSINPPLGILYRTALEYIPVFRMFRTSAYFILGTTIAYSILVPFTIVEIGVRLRRWKIISIFLVSILFILVMVNSYPILLGYPAYFQPDPSKPAQLGMKLPQDYYRLNDFFNSRPTEDVKTISLPIDPGYELLEDPFYFGIPMLPFIMNKPLINQRYQDFGTTFSLPLIMEKELVEGNPSAVFLLGISNIKYVIVKNNARYVEKDKTKQSLTRYFHFIKSFGSYDLYENPSFLPHIYIPSRVAITSAIPEQLVEVINTNKLQVDESIFFSTQNSPEKSRLLQNLKREENKLPTIEFKKMNQTKYKVIVQNASSDFPLIFSESFHNGWKVSIEGKTLSENYHLKANSFANSWIIKPQSLCQVSIPCDLELVIEYLPQKMARIGYLMTFITVIITFSYLLYATSRKK